MCLLLVATLDAGHGRSDGGNDPFFLPPWGSSLAVAKARFPGLAPVKTRDGDIVAELHMQPVDVAFGGARFREVEFWYPDGGLSGVFYTEKSAALGKEWVQRDAINAALAERYGPPNESNGCSSNWTTATAYVTHSSPNLVRQVATELSIAEARSGDGGR